MTKEGLGIATTIGCRRCGRRVCIIGGQEDNVCGPCRDVEFLLKVNLELHEKLAQRDDMLVAVGAGEFEDMQKENEQLQKENKELRDQLLVLNEMLDAATKHISNLRERVEDLTDSQVVPPHKMLDTEQ